MHKIYGYLLKYHRFVTELLKYHRFSVSSPGIEAEGLIEIVDSAGILGIRGTSRWTALVDLVFLATTYPPHSRCMPRHRMQVGFVSSHFTRRVLRRMLRTDLLDLENLSQYNYSLAGYASRSGF